MIVIILKASRFVYIDEIWNEEKSFFFCSVLFAYAGRRANELTFAYINMLFEFSAQDVIHH